MATKAELLEQAKAAGIEVTGKETKGELEALLRGVPPEEAAAEAPAGEFNAIMAGNVLHDGVSYAKGERVMLSDEVLALFSEQGFIEAGPAASAVAAGTDAQDEGADEEEDGGNGDDGEAEE